MSAGELDPTDPRATVCGVCGRGWDDSVPTSETPTPSGRCPFEFDHESDAEERDERLLALTEERLRSLGLGDPTEGLEEPSWGELADAQAWAEATVECAWFAWCDRPAAGCVDHPILGWVPTCERCADRLGLDLVRGDFEVVR